MLYGEVLPGEDSRDLYASTARQFTVAIFQLRLQSLVIASNASAMIRP
jgi:hypothetical protein